MTSLRWIPCLLIRCGGSLRSLHSNKRPGTQVNQAKTTGSLSNVDDDGNENGNNAIPVKHASKRNCTFLCCRRTSSTRKLPYFMFCGPLETTNFFLITQSTILKNSTPEILANTDELNEMEWARLSFKQCIFSFQVTFSFLLSSRSYFLSSLTGRQGRRRAQISDQNRTDQWQRSKFSTWMWAQSFPFLLFKSARWR